MDDMQFSEDTTADLEEAHDHCCDIWNAIDDLQQTDVWMVLPIETRRAICAARAHVGALADALSTVV